MVLFLFLCDKTLTTVFKFLTTCDGKGLCEYYICDYRTRYHVLLLALTYIEKQNYLERCYDDFKKNVGNATPAN